MSGDKFTQPSYLVPLWIAVFATLLAPSMAQRVEQTPEELENVGITEKLDAQVPLNLTFIDERGREVALSKYVSGKRPVILTLNYYSCPMLCTLLLNGLAEAMKEMPGAPGQEFEVVTVSIYPRETPTLAALKKHSYLKDYGRRVGAGGWHFLVGREDQIAKLADAVGFRYKYIDEDQQYAHTAGIFILTPSGRISKVLYGVMFDATTLKLSLLEASEGKVGSPLDQLILYCFHYDAKEGKYTPAVMAIMRGGGILGMAILGVFLFGFWAREWRRKKMPLEGSKT
ncbi:MAG: SCO family protein [bacterium]